EIVLALHRGGGTASAGIEADDVEARLDLVREDARELPRELDARSARTARVDEQRADALLLVGGAHAKQRDLDRLAVVGVVVVEGHRELGALVVASAALPVELRCRRSRTGGVRRCAGVRRGGRDAQGRDRDTERG